MAVDIPENPASFLPDVEREAHDWMTRFAAGNATAAELAAFKQWSARDRAHVEAFARACQLWEAVGPASELMHANAPLQQARRGHIGRRAFIGGAIAASSAAAYVAIRPPLELWPSLSELAADYRTAPGEQRSVVLAGGASVELNTRTSIVLRPSTEATERIELISGETAVAARPDKGRAIEVIAGSGRIAATDALFNVRYEDGVVCTTCVSGALEVAWGDRVTRLRPGHEVVYSRDAMRPVTAVNTATVMAWKDGVLVFQARPLGDAVAEINRYRSGRIIITNAQLRRRSFSARFLIANVDTVVTQIQQVFEASVTNLPGGIVLLG